MDLDQLSRQVQILADRQAILDLSAAYCEGVDRLDRAKLLGCFTEDALYVGPNFTYRGHEEIASMIPVLEEMFHYAWHAIHNVTVTLDGDAATAETYCTGRHLKRGATPERGEVLSMAIRYQDKLVRTAVGWKIAHRLQIREWTETEVVSGARV